MSDFLRELGYSPTNYWLFAGATFLLWFVSAIGPRSTSGTTFARFNRPELFGVLLLVAMFAWRWPAIFFYKPVNPDESQFIAAALTALARGNIWWSDTMTSAPLVVLPLLLPALLGLPVDFASARLIGLLENWGSILLVYATLRHLHGDKNARLLVTPLAGLMIFLLFWDFVPYCSERSPLFLCALAIWLCCTAFQADGVVRSRVRLAAGGFVIGLLPFSKFQVMPMGAAIGISTFCWVLSQPGEDRKNVRKNLLYLIGGTGAGLGLMIVSLWQSGEWSQVYQSYLIHNLDYVRARGLPWNESGYVLSYLSGMSWGFYSFQAGTLVLLAIGQSALRRTPWRPLLLGWSLLAVSYCAVLVPGRLYPHYLLFLSLPLTLLTGFQFGYLLTGQSRRRYTVSATLFLCIGIGSQLIDRVWDRHSLHRLIAVHNDRERVAAFLNQARKKGDTLTVWGWRPELYVETQLPQGTREAVTEAQLSNTPQRDYFRSRILADLRANQPAFFVDSVGPEDYLLKDRSQQGHEVIPGLGDYIQEHYTQVHLVDAFRVYVRRDRLSGIK